MFEVDPNLWLQSFASPWLTALMLGVSQLGYDWFYIAVIVVLAFGVRLRPTLGVMLAVLLAGVVTNAAKAGFELPRPRDVDARVLDNGEVHRALTVAGGAVGFFALPSPEARTALRATPDPSYGFISGHVSAATAMCLALLLFFRMRGRAAWIALCAWPLLMATSRMYLGKHFLADVVGGLFAGGLATLAAGWLLPLSAKVRTQRARLWLLAGGTLGLCVLAPFTPLLEQHGLGRLAGLVVVLGILSWRGFPADDGSLWQRVARIACLCLAYVAVDAAANQLGARAGWRAGNPAWLAVAAVATATMFLGGIAAARKLRLFRDPAVDDGTGT
jgi:membrane-associated phospholipid phosphatase